MQTPAVTESSLLTARALSVQSSLGRNLFQNVSFSLASGEILWVKGPRGSGKTTLLRLLGGTQIASDGDIEWLVEPEEICFVPEPGRLPIFSRVTFLDLIEREVGNRETAESSYVLGLIDKAYLGMTWNDATIELRRRLLVTMGLLRQPRLLILDEPFLDLDGKVARDLGQSLAIHLLEKRPEAIVIVSEEPLNALEGCGIPIRTVDLGA